MTDAPGASLFSSRKICDGKVHDRPPRKWVGTDLPGLGLTWSRVAAGNVRERVHNFGPRVCPRTEPHTGLFPLLDDFEEPGVIGYHKINGFDGGLLLDLWDADLA